MAAFGIAALVFECNKQKLRDHSSGGSA